MALSTDSLRTPACMLLNFVVSVVIIWFNKWAYQSGFQYNSVLTSLHFLFTWLGLYLASTLFNYFEIVTVPIRKMLPLSLAFIGFVVFNNLSLKHNTVGMYQLLKVMTTPVIVAIQYFLHSNTLPTKQAIALIPICIGVCLATVTQLEANELGLFFGVLGIMTTSFYQIWVKTEKEALGVSSQQLLYNQARLSFFLLLLSAPFTENVFGPEYVVLGGSKAA